MNWFNEAYRGTPPWDIGRPQREIVRLAVAGEIAGRILDVGCGTGENSLFLADRGLEVWGVDSAPLAVQKARQKAGQRGLRARFFVHDALELGSLGERFDTIIDCGLFHTLSDEERALFVESLSRALRRGGSYFMLCFSDKEPENGGPRRISKEDLRSTFRQGWKVNYIRGAKFEAELGDHFPRAWIASLTRL